MNVYVVSHRVHYESSDVVAVFSTEAAARAFAASAPDPDVQYPNEDWDVEEFTVDAKSAPLASTAQVSKGT